MTDIVVDGTVRAAYVATIASKAAPAVAELNAGLLLQWTLTMDGLVGFRPDTADVPNDALASKFDTVTIGRVNFSGTMLRLKRQTPLASDTLYNTLTKGTTGFIVIRRWIDEATAWAADQQVSVYPIICGETADMDLEKNTTARYEVPVKISADPVIRAVVAA
jgi:hypothetical protein